MIARWSHLGARFFAVLPAAALVMLVAGCGLTHTQGAGAAKPPTRPPLSTIAQPAEAAAYYLAGHLVDATLQPRASAPFAYWLVDVDATPTAAGATGALAFMARHYAHRGMVVILRIDRPIPGSADTRIVNLGWNPASAAADTGMFPRPVPSQAMEVDGGINHPMGLSAPEFTRILDDVPTATVTPDAPQSERLLKWIRTVALLR